MNGHIFVVNGPSGVGKGTLINRLLDEHPDFVIPNSYTTRQPRPDEGTRKKYRFVNREEFMRAVNDDKILEYEEAFGNLYGTDKESIDKELNANKTIIVEVEPKGAQTLKKIFGKDATLIFIAPPSIDSLKKRITHDQKRGVVDSDELSRRLARAEEELTYQSLCDVTIINEDDKVDETYQKLLDIIKSHT